MSLVTAQTATLKSAADSFEEEGLSVLDLSDLQEQEKPLDAPEPASEKKPKRSKPPSGRKAPPEWRIGDEWFVTKPEQIEGVVPKSLEYRLGKQVDVRREINLWVDDQQVPVRLTSGKRKKSTQSDSEGVAQAKADLSAATEALIEFWPDALDELDPEEGMGSVLGALSEPLSDLLDAERWKEQKAALNAIRKVVEGSDSEILEGLLDEFEELELERGKAKKMLERHIRARQEQKGPGTAQATNASYNYAEGLLLFPAGSAGKSFRTEFFLRGVKGEHQFQSKEEEYESVQALKRRGQNLWTSLLNHPDPEFVREHLIPIIEDELEHLREKDSSVPNLTSEMMTLEQLLSRLEDGDASYSRDEESFTLDDTFHELPAGTELRSITFEDSGERLSPMDDETEVDLDPEPGEFLLDGDALLFNEEDVGRPIKIVYNKPSNAKELVVNYIKDEIAPKLEAFHSLASLLSEQVYDLQTASDEEDLEGIPGLGEGARTLDPQFLRYVQGVRGDSNRLEKELTDFARFHMPKLAKLIQSGSTYYPGKKSQSWSEQKNLEVFRSSIKPIFEEAHIDMADLLKVALDAFRQAVLEFDYEKRPQSVGDPKDFRVVSNPFVWKAVATALRNLFITYREEREQKLQFAGQKTLTIPAGGGEVTLEKGMDPASVKVVAVETNKPFREGGGLSYVAGPSRGATSGFDLKNGTMANGQPSPFLGKKFHSPTAKGKTPTSISLRDSDGNEFKRVSSLQQVKESSERIFYFSTSSGLVRLPEGYVGTTFTVNVGGSGAVETDALVGKDEYAVNPTKGTIEFSPANGGQQVAVSYSVSRWTSRVVQPSTVGVEEGDEGGEAVTAPATELVPGEEASPEDQLAKEISEDNAQKILDHIEGVIYDPDETRLDDGERAILSGIFGIGQQNGQRLSIREIAQDEPFNIDVSTKKGTQEVSRLMHEVQPAAAAKLVEILKEKIGEDEGLQQIMRSRAFNKVLFEGERPTDKDKVLKFIKKNFKEEAAEDPTKGLRNFLGMLMPRAALSEDEENILRWTWSIQGPLRREDEDEDDARPREVMGGAPTPLPVVAELEFGIDAKDEKAFALVEKAYDRALQKFEKALDAALQKVGDKVKAQPWGKDFVPFYQGQRDRENFRALILDDETARVPPKQPEEKPEPKLSLFDRIRQSTRAEDEEILRDMLTELADAQKRGGDLSQLMAERQTTLDKASVSDRKKLFKEVADLHSSFLEASKQHADIQAEIKTLSEERRSLLQQIRESADADLIAQLEEAEAAYKAASDEDRPAAKKKLVELIKQARGGAPSDLQKEWKANTENLKRAKKELKEWMSLIQKQRDAIDKAHKNPLLRAQLEMDHLGYIQRYFTEHDEHDLGGGKYNLKNLFEPKSPGDLTRRVEEWTPKAKERGKGFMELEEERKKEEGAWVKEKEKLREERAKERKLEEETKKKELAEGLPPEEKEKLRKEVELRKEEAQTPFVPREKDFSDRKRSLYELLLPAVLPVHPEQSAKDRVEEVAKFRLLMERMRKFVTSGEGTVEEFLNDPKTSKKELLRDEADVLGRVKQFLTDHAQDLQTGEDSWDLSKLFVRKKFEEPEEDKVEPDHPPLGEAAEALQNAQDLSADEAKILHALISMLKRGKPVEKIKRGLQRSRSLEAGSAAEILLRLEIFDQLHPEAREEGYDSLYSGEHEFPTREIGEKRKPLQEQMGPLVDALHKQKKDEASKRREEPEPRSSIREKVLDMVSRMGDMAEDGFDLDDMSDHFLELDQAQEKPYSLAYLFQQVRNYLHRLNRTKGLQNMVSNYGLDSVFPQGAPLTSPADEEETTPALPVGEEPEVEKEPAGFHQLVEEQKLTGAEAEKAMQILQSTQLRMEDAGTPAGEIFKALMKRDALEPIVKKILMFLRDHKDKIVVPDNPGIPDLSFLTGMPYNPPDVSDDEAQAQEEIKKEEAPPPAPKPEAPKKAPRVDKVKDLVEKLRGDKSAPRREQRLRALLDLGAISPAEAYQAVMSARLPPREVIKLRSLFEHTEEGMEAMMPEPKEHGIIEEKVEGEEAAPEPTPAPAPAPAPEAPKKKGRLPKELAQRTFDSTVVQQITEQAGLKDVHREALDKYFPEWEKASSYLELKTLEKETTGLRGRLKKNKTPRQAWKKLLSAWRNYLRALPAEMEEAPPKATKRIPPAPGTPTGPVGKDTFVQVVKTLSVEERSALQQALGLIDKKKGLPPITEMTIEDWLYLGKDAKDPTSDFFVRDKAQREAVLKTVHTLLRLTMPPEEPAPAPAAPPAAPQAPPVDLERLKAIAIQSAQQKNWTADQFGQHIQQTRPDLMEAYQSVKPAVQKALDEAASKFEIDLSDL